MVLLVGRGRQAVDAGRVGKGFVLARQGRGGDLGDHESGVEAAILEANEFTQLAGEFAKHDTVVIGVSKDPCDMHRAFIAKYGLKIPLLADTDGTLCERYGVWQEKEKAGVKKMGIVRSTFLIDKNGNLVHVEYGVNPEGHAQAMLEKVSKLAG